MKSKVKVQIETLLPTMLASFQNNQIVEIKVTGNSMYPTLKDKETSVGLKKYSGVLLKKKIYFFKHDNQYVLHRYIKTKGNVHYFRGDALYKYECLESDENVLALVEYIKKHTKKINPYSFSSKFKLIIVLSFKQIKHKLRRMVKHSE